MKAHLHDGPYYRVVDVPAFPKQPLIVSDDGALYAVYNPGFTFWGGIPQFGGEGEYMDYYRAQPAVLPPRS